MYLNFVSIFVLLLFRMDVLLILINGIYILPNNFNYSKLFCASFLVQLEISAFFSFFFEKQQYFFVSFYHFHKNLITLVGVINLRVNFPNPFNPE